MRDPWIESEWKNLCQRVQNCAEECAGDSPRLRERFQQEAEAFERQEPPERYPHLLDRVRSAAELAKSWHAECERSESEQDRQSTTDFTQTGTHE